MKAFVLAVACLLNLSGVFAFQSCYETVNRECSSYSLRLSELSSCNASYGQSYFYYNEELKAFANLQLQRSYEYLLSASYFNNYKNNRPGISKLFRKLSDDAWEKTIGLIQHITMRGDRMDFAERGPYDKGVSNKYIVEMSELEALAKALDVQKELAEHAFNIHGDSITKSHKQDPEIAQYLEKEFIEDSAKTIRNLAGYMSDLKGFITSKSRDLSLALYVFDEYLQKTI